MSTSSQAADSFQQSNTHILLLVRKPQETQKAEGGGQSSLGAIQHGRCESFPVFVDRGVDFEILEWTKIRWARNAPCRAVAC